MQRRLESRLIRVTVVAASTPGLWAASVVANAPFFAANRVKLVQFIAEKRLPAIYFVNLFPDAGGLMSYGASLEDSYRRAAAYVDKILKGAKPGDLPIEQADEVRAGHQPEGGQDHRDQNSPVAAAASRPCHSVNRGRPTTRFNGPGLTHARPGR